MVVVVLVHTYLGMEPRRKNPIYRPRGDKLSTSWQGVFNRNPRVWPIRLQTASSAAIRGRLSRKVVTRKGDDG